MSLASIICDPRVTSRSPLSASTIDRSLAAFSQLFSRLYITRFVPPHTCSKRRSLTDIVGGATLERPSAKIILRNL